MPAATSVTAEHFLALPDRYDSCGNRIKEELIDGEIVLMAPPSAQHDLIKNRINELLILYLSAQPGSPFKTLLEIAFRISEDDVNIPDVSVVRRDRLSAKDRIVPGAPEIAIEVISPSETARHIKTKVDSYLAHGSQSVWVVWPDQQAVTVHSGAGIREVKGSGSIHDPLLPGFDTPVSAFFEL